MIFQRKGEEMREIKFRAWDNDNKQMIYQGSNVEYLNGAMEAHFCFDEAGFVLLIRPYAESEWYPINNTEAMQFTELRDKNGKEIYEGDIIVAESYPWFDTGKPNYRSTVEWIYSQWQQVLHCVNPDKGGISDGINEGLNDEGYEPEEPSSWLVIGNIYENPELLEVAP